VAVLAISFVAVQASPAAAAGPFVVDDPVDAVDAAIDGVCATSSGTCTLRAAVQEANASGGTTIVTFASSADETLLTLIGAGGAEEGDLDLTAGTTLRLEGNFINPTTTTSVRASSLDDRLFHVVAGSRLEMSLVELTGGSTTGDGGAILNDGAVLVETTPDFVGNVYAFRSNSADGYGGAVSTTAGATLDLRNISTAPTGSSMRFRDNSAGAGGGSLHTDGGTITATGSSATASHDVYIDNGTTDGDGGGIHIESGTVRLECRAFVRFSTADRGGSVYLADAPATFEMSGAGLDRGTAVHGGGVFLDGDGDGAVSNLFQVDPGCSSSFLSGSFASEDGGNVYTAGAVNVLDDADLIVRGDDGPDARNGGGIMVAPGGSLDVRGTLRVENTSAELDGGGLAVDGGPAAVPGVIDTLVGTDGGGRIEIVDADAGRDGGGISVRGAAALVGTVALDQNAAALRGGGLSMVGPSQVRLFRSELTRNSATDGAGLAASGAGADLVVMDSTIAGNTASGTGGGAELSDSTTVIAYSTIVDNAPNGVNGPGSLGAVVAAALLARNGTANCVASARSFGFTVADDDTCAAAPTDLTDPARFADVADELDQQSAGIYQPTPGNPAIDFTDCSDASPTDQLGNPRPLDGDGDGDARCDAGAIEAAEVGVPRTISGTVFDEATGAPLVGACVLAGPIDVDGESVFAITSSDGTWTVDSIAGRHAVAFFVTAPAASAPEDCEEADVAASYQPEWYRNVPVLFDPDGEVMFPDLDRLSLVDVTDGDVAGIDACLGTSVDGGADAPCRPVGPVGPVDPLGPTTTPSPFTPPAIAPSAAAPPPPVSPVSMPGAVGAGSARPGSNSVGDATAGRLAFTGSDTTSALIVLGLGLVCLGSVATLGLARRRPSRRI